MKTPSEMRAQAAAKKAEAQTIYDDILAADREPTAEEESRHDTLVSEAVALLDSAAAAEAREQRLNDLDSRLQESQGRQSNPLPHQDEENTRGGRHGYSLLKALRQADPSQKRDPLDGLELEVHQELQKRFSRLSKGLLIPWDLTINLDAADRGRRLAGAERRDLTTTTGAGAVFETVSTTMIELLRNRMLMRSLGARILADLNGTFSLPKQTAGGTAYWVTEGNAPTESNQTIGSVDFAPSTVGAFTDYSRAFLSQTSVDAEMFVREDLATVLAIELDRVGFNGSGSGAEPEGIIPNSNVNVVAIGTNGGAPTWDVIVQLEQEVETDNALDGTLYYVTNAKGRGKMKRTTKIASSTFADFLWDPGDLVNGYPARSSNQIPSNLDKGTSTDVCSALIFGNFAQAIYALWGGIDVLVDPYTGGNAGNVRIVELQDADFQLRQPVAFGVIKDMTTT